MADLTGILRQTFTVPAQSIKTIDFKDKQPNYFHIQNIGTDVIYFSVHGMPTAAYYDMKIDGGSIGTFTDTYQQPEAYIFNPSTEDVNVIMLSFSAPFDPVVLAQANKQITIGGTIETDGVVKGFQTALPSGSNKIGNVGISGALPTGSNKIGKVEMTGTEFTNLAAKVSEIRTKLDSLSFDIGAVTVDEVSIKDDGVQMAIFKTTVNNSTMKHVKPPEGYYISKICWIIPDGNISVLPASIEGFPIIENVINLTSELNININCKVGLISFSTSSTNDVNVYVYAEIKPYKVTTETLTMTNTNGLKPGDKIIWANSDDVKSVHLYTHSGTITASLPYTIADDYNPDDTATYIYDIWLSDDSRPVGTFKVERTIYSC